MYFRPAAPAVVVAAHRAHTPHTHHTHTHRGGFWMIIYLGKSEVNVSNEGRQELDSAADACGVLTYEKGASSDMGG